MLFGWLHVLDHRLSCRVLLQGLLRENARDSGRDSANAPNSMSRTGSTGVGGVVEVQPNAGAPLLRSEKARRCAATLLGSV